MEEPVKMEQDNSIVSCIEDDLMGGAKKRMKLEEPLDAATRTEAENVEGELTVSKSLQQSIRISNSIQELVPLAGGEEERVGRSNGARPVQFEFHFPEEVWVMILEMVDDADRVNCCRALPYLDRVLTSSKTVFLSDQVFPLMDKWLQKTDSLNCRRVCKKWCAAEDQVMYSKRAQPIKLHFDGDSSYQFRNVEEVDRFLQKFSTHTTRSPIIDGTVCIDNENEEGMDVAYPERVLQLLRQFGRHVKILQMAKVWTALNLLEWYWFLHEALRNTPNLRQLTICEGIRIEDDDDALELSSHMMLTPLPFIASLESLHLHMDEVMSSEAAQIVHNMLMLCYATQLKALTMDVANWKDHYAPKLVQLSELHLFNLNVYVDLERLLYFTAASVLLAKIDLLLSYPLSVPVLLGALKKFPLLQHVYIAFHTKDHGLEDGEDISNLSHLQVPGITSLKIGCYNGTTSYNFLQMFPSLRRLIMIIRTKAAQDIEKRVSGEEGRHDNLQIFEILEDRKIYDSNIWKLIPSLKYVKIVHFHLRSKTVLSGTREGYEEYSSNQN